MKNRVIKLGSQLVTVAVLTITLAGAVFPQKPIEPVRRQIEQNVAGGVSSAAEKKNNSKESRVSPVNRTNFVLSSKFVSAIKDAAYLDSDETAAKSAIVDLVYLIDAFEGQPEAAVLQRILKSAVRKTATAAQVGLEIEKTSKLYSNHLPRSQKWYFNAGTALTNLVFDTYVNDDAAMKSALSEIRELMLIAPKDTPAEITIPMNSLAKYVAAAFTEKDYAAIFQNSVGLVNSING